MLLFQHIWGSCQCIIGRKTYISYVMHNLREIRLAVGKELLYYFKTKFPICCHLSKSSEGYQVHIRYKLYLVTFGNRITESI